MPRFEQSAALLADAIERRLFPAAAAEVGTADGPIWRTALGRLTYEADAAPATDDTVFDLASLTKPICTTSVAMRLVEEGRLRLSDRVSRRLPHWSGGDRAHVTIRDLLEHCAGLAAWLPLYRECRGRTEFAPAIATLALEYAPWTRSVYSDLGFILLAFILEDAGEAPLDRRFAPIAGELAIGFTPPGSAAARAAPTEVDPFRGRLLIGEVHDENAWALGGVAGHAGLFGTAEAVGGFARLVLETTRRQTRLGRPDTLARFLTRSTVPGSSRTLGWDTMLPTSSCGTRMSPAAFGHTGFTGTSLWIDPAVGVYVVLLTNRVYPSRHAEGFQPFRAEFHDAVMDAVAS